MPRRAFDRNLSTLKNKRKFTHGGDVTWKEIVKPGIKLVATIYEHTYGIVFDALEKL